MNNGSWMPKKNLIYGFPKHKGNKDAICKNCGSNVTLPANAYSFICSECNTYNRIEDKKGIDGWNGSVLFVDDYKEK